MTAKDDNLLARLTAASARLKEVGSADLAAAVDEAIAPAGWGKIRRAVEGDTGNPTLNVRMPEELKARIVAAAAAAGNELPDDIVEALRRFADGSFSPAAPVRARRGSAQKSTNLSARIDPAIRERAEAAAADRAGDLGYTATATSIVTAWLVEKYGLQTEPKATPAK
ncbi:hypothetical protein [Streptomyces sp. NPDC058745]|uniref:hypothetical protein n=1 Tax=Streptomyces sp. NPDC058745 TaxID=3346621 RepID=UPI0036B40FD2